jgi:hypothetical protein
VEIILEEVGLFCDSLNLGWVQFEAAKRAMRKAYFE